MIEEGLRRNFSLLSRSGWKNFLRSLRSGYWEKHIWRDTFTHTACKFLGHKVQYFEDSPVCARCGKFLFQKDVHANILEQVQRQLDLLYRKNPPSETDRKAMEDVLNLIKNFAKQGRPPYDSQSMKK
jgi:hypothetical protein